MTRLTIALMFAVLFALIAGVVVMLYPVAVSSAQIDPTSQQATIDAKIGQLFAQTAQAESLVQATQTAQTMADQVHQSMTATVAFQSTIDTAFNQALTATARAASFGLTNRYVWELMAVSFDYPQNWIIEDAGIFLIFSDNAQVAVSSDVRNLVLGADHQFTAFLFSAADSHVANFPSSETLTLNGKLLTVSRQDTKTDDDFDELHVLVNVGGRNFSVEVFTIPNFVSEIEPYILSIAASIESEAKIQPTPTQKPVKPTAAPTVTPLPNQTAYEVTLQIEEIRCNEEQEDRLTDLGNRGDEIILVYQLAETNMNGRGMGLKETKQWTAPASLQAGDYYTQKQFDPIVIHIGADRGFNVAFELYESDPIGQNNFGGRSQSYTGSLIAGWLASGQNGVRQTEVISADGLTNSYNYTVTYTVRVKPL